MLSFSFPDTWSQGLCFICCLFISTRQLASRTAEQLLQSACHQIQNHLNNSQSYTTVIIIKFSTIKLGCPSLSQKKKKSINLQLPYVLQIPSLILATEYAFSSFHIALPFDKILRKDILVLPPRETCNGKELYDRPRQSSGKTFTQHITFHSFVTFAFTILNKFSSCIAVCLFLHSAFK